MLPHLCHVENPLHSQLAGCHWNSPRPPRILDTRWLGVEPLVVATSGPDSSHNLHHGQGRQPPVSQATPQTIGLDRRQTHSAIMVSAAKAKKQATKKFCPMKMRPYNRFNLFFIVSSSEVTRCYNAPVIRISCHLLLNSAA